MSRAFILRFLEDCIPADSITPPTGMMTKTAQPREGDVQDSPLAVRGILDVQAAATVTGAGPSELERPREGNAPGTLLAVPGDFDSRAAGPVVTNAGATSGGMPAPRPREGDAPDSPLAVPGALCNRLPSIGTGTATKVNLESADADACGQVFSVAALAVDATVKMATQSTTFTSAEASDKDRDSALFRSGLQCF